MYSNLALQPNRLHCLIVIGKLHSRTVHKPLDIYIYIYAYTYRQQKLRLLDMPSSGYLEFSIFNFSSPRSSLAQGDNREQLGYTDYAC